MDIYAAKVTNGNAKPSTQASALALNGAQSAIESWLQFALSLEEKQFVPLYLFPQFPIYHLSPELTFNNMYADLAVILKMLSSKKCKISAMLWLCY